MDDSPQRTLKPNEYRCAICKQVYTKGWSEEEAQAETQSYWPGVAQQDCAVVCDDCWQTIHPETHPEEYQASLLEAIERDYRNTLNEICTAYAIPPAMLGFVDTNRNAHQQSQEEAYRRLLNRYFRGRKS